ncbi:MAG: GNAT family N-acetyltransferase [Alphaproteobacteria bacterium]|nr:GNAT family N-acetyltransferase [Alphaproteobacteria bacterium]MBU1562050.1 GNAT family N-acetyltransferase [Alphaproteobacteria bacterium]MBU2301751.1 GNAT family N-acetyltransferase [Alphaproteobacteria bacterium]MBU2369579.1 GNAT family N-acetyltransferase [Alphaproteobacteria bacterium]
MCIVSDYQLRQFEWADVPAITAIYKHYVENTAITFDTEVPGEEAIAEKYAGLRKLGHPLIIAELDGQPVGYAYASFYRPRAAYRFTCEDSIYLHPDAKGRGIGKALLTELLLQSRVFGFKQMIAVITADTANSIAIHEKFGFRHVGRYEAVGYKFDRWHDIVHLQLGL